MEEGREGSVPQVACVASGAASTELHGLRSKRIRELLRLSLRVQGGTEIAPVLW